MRPDHEAAAEVDRCVAGVLLLFGLWGRARREGRRVMGAAVAKAAVRERPILFSAPMVRAILDGRKTQTRRWLSDPEGFASDADRFVDRDGFWHPCADVLGRGLLDE